MIITSHDYSPNILKSRIKYVYLFQNWRPFKYVDNKFLETHREYSKIIRSIKNRQRYKKRYKMKRLVPQLLGQFINNGETEFFS